MNYTPYIMPNVCEWSPAPEFEFPAPTKGQHTPYILPPGLPPYRMVCDRNQCAPMAFDTQNSGLDRPGALGMPLIYNRGMPGPWQRVGYVVANGGDVNTRDKTMPLFARTIDTRRDKYDFRVTDVNGVAIDVASNHRWYSSGDSVHVDGRDTPYTVKLYKEYV